MNFIDAYKSRKGFRRKGEAAWCVASRGGIANGMRGMSDTDLLADDWEVDPGACGAKHRVDNGSGVAELRCVLPEGHRFDEHSDGRIRFSFFRVENPCPEPRKPREWTVTEQHMTNSCHGSCKAEKEHFRVREVIE